MKQDRLSQWSPQMLYLDPGIEEESMTDPSYYSSLHNPGGLHGNRNLYYDHTKQQSRLFRYSNKSWVLLVCNYNFQSPLVAPS